MTTAAEMTWADHQRWEANWWGDCANTFSEENKQITYAHRMGLVNEPDPYTGAWPSYDLGGRSVIDIGGGPVSILLKCRNRSPLCNVTDPCDYPEWVSARYAAAGITHQKMPGGEMYASGYDEAWIYNVLQHTEDPGRIITKTLHAAPRLRIFEWIDTPPEPGHPQTLTADQLDAWCGGRGTVEQMNENGCVGRAWYGVFGS